MQRNWIGRCEGARGRCFAPRTATLEIPVFTTRPDTLFGATFFLVAPGAPAGGTLVEGRPEAAAVLAYAARRRPRVDWPTASATDKPRPASFTGRHVVNPINGEQVPVWVADYVLMDYGTGAIMAVPGHDERDFAFATAAYDLPIRRVVADAADRRRRAARARRSRCAGRMVNSGFLDGLGGRARPRRLSRHGLPSAGSARRPSASGCATG